MERALVLEERLKNVATQILVLDGIGEHLMNIGRIDRLILRLQVRSFETDLVQQPLHDGVQAASADIFRLLIDLRGKVCDCVDGVGREIKLDTFGLHQRAVLCYE